jgi:adenosylmethionine-8-amino-7-oxononanoate aminotransferase
MTTNIDFDRKHIWHPYSSMSNPSQIHEVVSASGVRLKLEDGREVIDGMSSWWSAIHGYNHPVLNHAATEQLGKMAHVMFGGLTHEPAVSLAKKLIELTADSLQHIFFADSGSVSVEVAIKMAIQHWFAQGLKTKNKLLTVHNGYHGDTFGAMAVCDPVNGMHSMFESILAKHYFAPAPQAKSDSEWQSAEMAEFDALIQRHHDEIAAVILEPLVQGAGGMRVYSTEFLRHVRKRCDEYNVLLILDEIATGFGRTGSLFAYEQANIEPDILCLGKAITGGYMTLAATLCSRRVAEGIGADGYGVLMHGPTFMANPLACAVANASIDLLLSSDWQSNVSRIEQQLELGLREYERESNVKEVRVKGAIGVVELQAPLDAEMSWLPGFIIEQGVWIRPFRNLIYIMPPYIINDDDLAYLTQAIGEIIKKLQSVE